MSPASPTRPLTGRMVFGITVGAFAVIIGVNVVLAVQAVRTFSGLVVPNSYVASQTFDHDRDAQLALGWTLGVSDSDDTLHVALTDATGSVVRPQRLSIAVGRPAAAPRDVSPLLVETAQGYGAPLALAPGDWRVEIDALAADGTRFRQRRNLTVAP